MKKPFKIISFFFILVFCFFMLFFKDSSKNAVINGLAICGNTVIPSLFPFTFCSIYILKALESLKIKNEPKIINKLFSLNFNEFSSFLLSFIGGYPTGAKLVAELYKNAQIAPKKANLMLCYCVNSGPAFLIMTVGGFFANEKIGYILFLAHISASILIALILSRFMPKQMDKTASVNKTFSLTEQFIYSVKEAAACVFSICQYVILFSVINSFFIELGKIFSFLNLLPLVLEITLAVTKTKNIYTLAFLCGFAGVSVWLQILSVTKDFKKNLPLFVSFRIIHGLLSSLLIFILLKIFKIHFATFSNNINITFKGEYSNTALFFSLISMAILFIISTKNKKCW